MFAMSPAVHTSSMRKDFDDVLLKKSVTVETPANCSCVYPKYESSTKRNLSVVRYVTLANVFVMYGLMAFALLFISL